MNQPYTIEGFRASQGKLPLFPEKYTLDLASIRLQDTMSAIYLAICELWYGRSLTQITERIQYHCVEETYSILEPLFDKYTDLFMITMTNTIIYISWYALPTIVQQRLQEGAKNGTVTLGYRRCLGGLYEEISLGRWVPGDTPSRIVPYPPLKTCAYIASRKRNTDRGSLW